MPRWARTLAGIAEMSVPANAIVPRASGKSPMIAFISVVLPTPLRPTMATISPVAMARLTSRTIIVRP